MHVELKTSDITITLGNKGILLKISDPTTRKHVGDLRIGRGTINWMTGKTHEPQGKKIKMADFIQMLEDY